MEEVKTVAVELQDLLQAKVGTTKFSEVYNRVRQGVMSVRRERKSARAVQVCFLLFAFAFVLVTLRRFEDAHGLSFCVF